MEFSHGITDGTIRSRGATRSVQRNGEMPTGKKERLWQSHKVIMVPPYLKKKKEKKKKRGRSKLSNNRRSKRNYPFINDNSFCI